MAKIEDALQASRASIDPSNLRLQEAFPTRPGYGTKGRAVVLWANYVALTASPKLVLYRYDISSVSPAAAGKKLAQIMRLLVQAPELAELKGDVVTDFKSTLISRRKLEDQTVAVQYRAEGEDEPRAGSTPYRVQLKFTNILAVSQLTEYLTSTSLSARYDEQLPMIQAFNIFLNHYAKSSGNLATIGASKTFSIADKSDTWDLTNCLTAVRGFFASVRAATARVLVNVNVSHGAFYQEGPLDQFILRSSAQRGLYKLESFLKGLRVRTTHLKDKTNRAGEVIPRVKTVFGLANRNDGHGLAHPPRVGAFGAGPKEVEFWLESGSASGTSASTGQKKGGKKAKPTGAAGGRYVSVYEFFVSGESMPPSAYTRFPANTPRSVWHPHRQPRPARHQCRQQREPDIPAAAGLLRDSGPAGQDEAGPDADAEHDSVCRSRTGTECDVHRYQGTTDSGPVCQHESSACGCASSSSPCDGQLMHSVAGSVRDYRLPRPHHRLRPGPCQPPDRL